MTFLYSRCLRCGIEVVPTTDINRKCVDCGGGRPAMRTVKFEVVGPQSTARPRIVRTHTKPRVDASPCGTRGGYGVHKRWGTPFCEACLSAYRKHWRDYQNARRAKLRGAV